MLLSEFTGYNKNASRYTINNDGNLLISTQAAYAITSFNKSGFVNDGIWKYTFRYIKDNTVQKYNECASVVLILPNNRFHSLFTSNKDGTVNYILSTDITRPDNVYLSSRITSPIINLYGNGYIKAKLGEINNIEVRISSVNSYQKRVISYINTNKYFDVIIGTMANPIDTFKFAFQGYSPEMEMLSFTIPDSSLSNHDKCFEPSGCELTYDINSLDLLSNDFDYIGNLFLHDDLSVRKIPFNVNDYYIARGLSSSKRYRLLDSQYKLIYDTEYKGKENITGFVEGVTEPVKVTLVDKYGNELEHQSTTNFEFLNYNTTNLNGNIKIGDTLTPVEYFKTQQRGYISASVVITECIDSDFVIHCFRSSDKQFIGEYPIIDDRYTIDNLNLTQTYDIMLHDRNKVVETQVHSRRTPSIYQ